MTALEQLIDKQVSTSVVATVARATDRIAEKMAQEILRDPAFREEIQTLIRQAFRRTVGALTLPDDKETA